MKIKPQTILIPLLYSGLFFITNYFGSEINYYNLVLFFIGITSGTILMTLDETFLYKYYLDPNAKEISLITRSLVFILSLFPMGIYIITSTGSEMGVGLFLGIITILLLELIFYRQTTNLFHLRFMSQLKRKLSDQEIKYFVASFSILTLIFILLTFFLGR